MLSDRLKKPPFWQRLPQAPKNPHSLQTEESLVLRILVQTLVIIGIIATDVAAQTQTSIWAVPLSIGGMIWSWHRRHKRNIAMKFILAIAMLVVLASFLGNLLVNLNDSRLSLAELLIQLQVLHSFDLPRRKDLGYSMVIGLILLGVAGTIAETLAFAPWLILFLIVAIPTLILDYRSRLGLEKIDGSLSLKFPKKSRKNAPIWQTLSPQRLGLFLVIILIVGLLVFALMPRFPGYQLQAFPVGGGGELTNQGFEQENRDIVNPGYVRQGDPNANNGNIGTSPLEGAGTVDQTFYYGFNSTINQNLRGTMKPELVMRVRSQAPGFWRVMAFDEYTGQGWNVSKFEKLSNLPRSVWSYRFQAPLPPIYTQTKQIIQSYSIVSVLPNVIPALFYPHLIYFPAREVAMDSEGGLRSPGVLSQGLTYTVISQVPYRNRTLLNTASQKYPEDIKESYLQLPSTITERVRIRTEELLARSPKPLTSAYEKTLYLAQALKQNYQIIPDLGFFEENEDLVEAFLFRYQGGYPDHFSTVLTVMLRSIGIPARLVTGFGTGRFNPLTGYYLVYNTDAHALTEVYFPSYGWFTFDPIPGNELLPPSIEEDQTFSVLRQLWQWVAGWLPSPIASFFSILWSEVIGRFLSFLGWLWNFVSGSLLGVLVGLIGAVAVAFLGWLSWLQVKGLTYRRRLAKLPPMEKIYRQMLNLLKTRGYPKHPAQTPLEYARDADKCHSPEIAELIARIAQAYMAWRYGECPPDLASHQQQLKTLEKLLNRWGTS